MLHQQYTDLYGRPFACLVACKVRNMPLSLGPQWTRHFSIEAARGFLSSFSRAVFQEEAPAAVAAETIEREQEFLVNVVLSAKKMMLQPPRVSFKSSSTIHKTDPSNSNALTHVLPVWMTRSATDETTKVSASNLRSSRIVWQPRLIWHSTTHIFSLSLSRGGRSARERRGSHTVVVASP